MLSCAWLLCFGTDLFTNVYICFGMHSHESIDSFVQPEHSSRFSYLLETLCFHAPSERIENHSENGETSTIPSSFDIHHVEWWNESFWYFLGRCYWIMFAITISCPLPCLIEWISCNIRWQTGDESSQTNESSYLMWSTISECSKSGQLASLIIINGNMSVHFKWFYLFIIPQPV